MSLLLNASYGTRCYLTPPTRTTTTGLPALLDHAHLEVRHALLLDALDELEAHRALGRRSLFRFRGARRVDRRVRVEQLAQLPGFLARPVWKSTVRRRNWDKEPPRHRGDAVTKTTSRRWRKSKTQHATSSRRCRGRPPSSRLFFERPSATSWRRATGNHLFVLEATASAWASAPSVHPPMYWA